MPLIILPKAFQQFILQSVPVITTPPLPGTTVGSVYSIQFTASGGTQPYKWSIYSDTGSGSSINSTTGVMSSPTGTVGTFVIVIQVTDANGVAAQSAFTLVVSMLSIQATQINTVLLNAWTPPPQPPFPSPVPPPTSTALAAPQLGGVIPGGQGSYVATEGYFSHLDMTILGFYDGWEGGANGTMKQLCLNVNNNSVRQNGSKIWAYYDHFYIGNNAAVTPMTNAKFLLYPAYPSNLTPVLQGSNPIADITPNNSPTVNSGTPPTTRNANQWGVDYQFDYQINGGALGLAVNPVTPNPLLGALFWDDTNAYTTYSGDTLRVNSSQAAGDATASQALRNAWASMASRMRALAPNLPICANISGLYSNPVTTGMSGIFDYGLAEHAMGWVNSSDSTGGWLNLFTVLSQYQLPFLKSGGHVLVGHINITDSGQDFYRTSAGQAIRYGLATAIMLDPLAFYCPGTTNSTPNTTLTNAISNYNAAIFSSNFWFDEFAVNLNTYTSVGYSDSTLKQWTGWMGSNPIDTGVITTDYVTGIRMRRYALANGKTLYVFLNRTTSAINLTLPVPCRAIQGIKTTGVNNGATNLTSINIPGSDARFLVSM